MKQKTLNLTIARVDGPVFAGEVVSVTVPGTEGEMTLLADHAALVSALKAGTITYELPSGEAITHDITSGTLEVRNNHATILI
jgi:F-type H+-transporting ATPase subunit epsilon